MQRLGRREVVVMSAIGTKRTWAGALHMSAFDPKRTSRAILSVGANAFLRSLPALPPCSYADDRRAQMCVLVAADEPNPNRPTVVKANATAQRSGPANPGHQGTSPGKRTNSTNGMSANAMRMPFIQ